MKVLFLTHRLPYAPDRGDRIRAYHLLRELSRTERVSLVSLVHDDQEAARQSDIDTAEQVTCVRVPRVRNLTRGALALTGPRPLTHALLDAPGLTETIAGAARTFQPDMVLAYCSGMARFCVDGPLAALPFVLDMVDVDSAKWAALARTAGIPMRWLYRREARTLQAFERRACDRAHSTLVVNERERATLAGIAPNAAIHVVENGIDADAFRPAGAPAEAPVVVFVGVMNYRPNEEGAIWFAEHVWPIVKRQHPGARFTIVGAEPTQAVSRLAAQDASIEVTGRVPHVQPYLWQSAVAVAPLHTARGLQNKVLEALAAGLPVVVTPAVAEGLPREAAAGCRVGNDAPAFARAVADLLSQPASTRRAIAFSVSLASLAWSQRLSAVPTLLSAAASR